MVHIYQIIVDSLGFIVSVWLWNSQRVWLLSDALNYAMSMSIIFKDEIDFTTFDNFMEEYANINFELSCLTFNI
jgi:hypothetical protein